MGRMAHDEAMKTLESSRDSGELARAVASLIDDQATRPEELLPALDCPGYVAEQAAIALHRLTGTPWPSEGNPDISRSSWERRLKRISTAVG